MFQVAPILLWLALKVRDIHHLESEGGEAPGFPENRYHPMNLSNLNIKVFYNIMQ